MLSDYSQEYDVPPNANQQIQNYNATLMVQQNQLLQESYGLPQMVNELLDRDQISIQYKELVLQELTINFRTCLEIIPRMNLSKSVLNFIDLIHSSQQKNSFSRQLKAVCRGSQGRSLFLEYLDNFDRILIHEKLNITVDQLEYHIQAFRAAAQDLSLWNVPFTPKNLPPKLGNYFKKWIQKVIKKLKIKFKAAIQTFVNLKKRNQQSMYRLQDFQVLCRDNQGQQLFLFYLKNQAYLDILNSYQQANPEKIISFLDVYIAGAQNPEEWNSHYNPIT